MKIHFEIRDGNYNSITKRYRELIELSEIYWWNNFLRTQLSVFFIEEHEFSKNIPHPALQHDSAGNAVNDKSPETETMGIYFPFHDEYGPDVVLICPQRIEDISKKCYLSFDSLLNKVFTHELAHSLMTKDVFSLSEAGLHQIPSFKFFEESLCNAFALLHFNNQENELLRTFCRSQSSGYCDFHIWGDSFENIISSMDNYKNLKGDCHCWINYFWVKDKDKDKDGYDFLSKSKDKVVGISFEKKKAYFNYDVKNAAKLKPTSSHNHTKTKSSIYKLLIDLQEIVLDGSSFSHDMRETVDKACCSIGYSIMSGTEYLFVKQTDCGSYICLDINGISVFSIEKDILGNIETDDFNIISFINV